MNRCPDVRKLSTAMQRAYLYLMNQFFVTIDLTVLQVQVVVQVLQTLEQMIIARSDVRALGKDDGRMGLHLPAERIHHQKPLRNSRLSVLL